MDRPHEVTLSLPAIRRASCCHHEGMSTSKRVVVIGGGGMSRGVLDVIDAINLDQSGLGRPRYEVIGVLADPEPNIELLEARGVKYLGSVVDLQDLPGDVGYVIGIGDSHARKRLDEYGLSLGRSSPSLVHPNAHLGFDVQVAPGAVICSHVSVESNVRIGRHVHVNQNSTIGHDTVLGDWSTVSPLTAISGNVFTGEAVFVGAGASVREGTALGSGCTVGMGAAVVSDVDAMTTVVGVPARATAARSD